MAHWLRGGGMTEVEREYRRYLTSVARVPAGLHDRYVGWVRGFLTRPGAGESVKDASKRSVALEEYGRSIGKAEAPSTVATALNAVRHFWYFLDRRGAGRGAGGA